MTKFYIYLKGTCWPSFVRVFLKYVKIDVSWFDRNEKKCFCKILITVLFIANTCLIDHQTKLILLSFSTYCIDVHSTVNKRNQIWLLSKYFIIYPYFNRSYFVEIMANIQSQKKVLISLHPSIKSTFISKSMTFFLVRRLFILYKNFFFRFGSSPVRRKCWWNKKESE